MILYIRYIKMYTYIYIYTHTPIHTRTVYVHAYGVRIDILCRVCAFSSGSLKGGVSLTWAASDSTFHCANLTVLLNVLKVGCPRHVRRTDLDLEGLYMHPLDVPEHLEDTFFGDATSQHHCSNYCPQHMHHFE